jgi:hypothetical protein
VLTALSVALLVFTGGSVNAVLPLRHRGLHRHLDGRLQHDQTSSMAMRTRLATQAGGQLVRGLMSTVWWDLPGGHVTEGVWLKTVVLRVLVFIYVVAAQRYRAEPATPKEFRADR